VRQNCIYMLIYGLDLGVEECYVYRGFLKDANTNSWHSAIVINGPSLASDVGPK